LPARDHHGTGWGIMIAVGGRPTCRPLSSTKSPVLAALFFQTVFYGPEPNDTFHENLVMTGGFLAFCANGAGQWSIDTQCADVRRSEQALHIPEAERESAAASCR
jgi:hypothetical protein